MSEITPNTPSSKLEELNPPKWRPMRQRLARLAGRGQTREEWDAARIFDVRTRVAQLPGVPGRLGRLADRLVLTPPEDASIEAAPQYHLHNRAVHKVVMSFLMVGNVVEFSRITDFDYDRRLGSGLGFDEFHVVLTPSTPAEPAITTEVVKADRELRKIGIRARPNVVLDDPWLLHGMHREGEGDSHPGCEYKWQSIGEAAANAFLDKVFGPEELLPQTELPPTVV